MITPIQIEDVFAWLEQFEDDFIVGMIQDASRCPFSRFLGDNWFVYTHETMEERAYEVINYENPEWMAQCIDYIDSIYEIDDRITKKQFCEALRKC